MNERECKKLALTPSDYYEEANTSRRYYLSLAVNARNIALVQGLAVLAGFGVLLRFDLQAFLPIPAGFALLFTIILACLHWNYLKYFEDCQEYLIKLENEFWYPGAGFIGFCTVIEPSRDKRVGAGWRRYVILYGTFILMGLTTVSLFVYSLYCNWT